MGDLSDLTVLSLEQATVLPFMTYRLAQDGARVIRLEHPVYGDPNRLIGDNALGEERMNIYYLCINAGKEALTLNLAEPQGRQLLSELLTRLDVDVFATNQLPRNYDKLGISYEKLSAIKPDLIWIGVTGFGPQSNEGAYDPILQARGGLMELTGEPDGEPQVVGIPLPDMGTSDHAYGELMKALFARSQTGRGRRIDLSMFESTVSWLTVAITLTASFGKNISRRGNTHEFFCPVSVFPTSDGYVYLAVGNDRQWKAFTELDEFSSLADPRYEKNAGRIADVDDLNQKISAVTRGLTTAGLLQLCRRITVPASPIQSIPEVIADPLVRDKLLSAIDPRTGTKLTLAPPPLATDFLEKNNRTMTFPPRFGQHNEVVYGGELGHSAEEMAAWRDQGVI
ncbi:MAG: CoA transferase [Proteobacteria bacterium]|nr:CoA transferase [Pseudomonadota bacterium]MBU1741349.1 CoA transferase [Pseudomonadota bacterium]